MWLLSVKLSLPQCTISHFYHPLPHPTSSEWVSKRRCGALFLTRIKHWQSAALFTSLESKGISALVPEASPPTSELGFWSAVPHILTPLSGCSCSTASISSFLNSIFQRCYHVMVTDGSDLGQQQVDPCSSLTTKTLPHKPNRACICVCQICRRETQVLLKCLYLQTCRCTCAVEIGRSKLQLQSKSVRIFFFQSHLGNYYRKRKQERFLHGNFISSVEQNIYPGISDQHLDPPFAFLLTTALSFSFPP